MKRILFLTIVLMIAAVSVLSQTKKKAKGKAKAKVPDAVRAVPVDDAAPPPLPPVPDAKKKPVSISDVFKEVKVGKHGVATFQIPQDLTVETGSEKPTTNKNVSWVNFSRNWKKTGDEYPYAFEVDLDVTTWNNELKEVVPDLKPELATPENMLLMDLIGDAKNKNTPGSFVKESKGMEIDGVSGGFFLADAPSDKTRFTLSWYTYRYFEGKPQRISLTFAGAKTEMEKALKIIESLKLEK